MKMVDKIRKDSAERHAKMLQEIADKEQSDSREMGNTVASRPAKSEPHPDVIYHPCHFASVDDSHTTLSHIHSLVHPDSHSKSVPNGGKPVASQGSKCTLLQADSSSYSSKQADASAQADAWVCCVCGRPTNVKDTAKVDGKTEHLCRGCSSVVGHLRALGVSKWPKLKRLLKQNYKSWNQD